MNVSYAEKRETTKKKSTGGLFVRKKKEKVCAKFSAKFHEAI